MNIHFKKQCITFTILIITGLIAMTIYSRPFPQFKINMTTPYEIFNSPQYQEGKFQGPAKVLNMTPDSMLKSALQYFKKNNNQEPSIHLPVQPVDLSFLTQTGQNTLNSTWIGHSSLMINISGYRILTDPVFETKVSLVGPTRYIGEPPFSPDALPDIDLVIISHDHYDHLNKSSVTLLNPKTRFFVTPLGVGSRLIKWGIPENKIVELDWWDSFDFDEKLKIIATPAQHFSGRGLFDRNKTLWASWAIQTDRYKLFFSGDSGYFNGFKKIGDKLGPFDITFLECGAYDRLWHGVHMFPEETIQAHLDLKGNILHPIHWGTFNLAHHSWDDPMIRAKKAADKRKIRLATPMVGQTIDYPAKNFGMPWWEDLSTN